MPGEHQVDCVDDVVQEIGLICGVAVGASENHPIGAAGREYIHRSRPEVGKQTAPGATVSRRLAVHHTLVDCLMVAGLNSPIEVRIALGLHGRIAVKGSGEIQQSAWAHQGTEAWQRRGHIYQVEKGLPDQQVPGPAALLAGHEMRHVDRLGFYRDVLSYPPKMQLSLGVLVHLKSPLASPLAEAAAGFGQQRGSLVNSRVGRMGEQITGQEPLHHAADAGSHLENAQGLLRGGSWQSRYQALPDLPIQRPVVYALLGSEVTH